MTGFCATLPCDSRGAIMQPDARPWRIWAAPACARPREESPVDETAGQEVRDADLAARGDGEAYRRIVQRHQDSVAAMMWRFSRDPETHEELVQDVFVEVYASLPSYRAEAPLSHWISRIATRTGYRYWKKQTRRRRHEPLSVDEWDQLPAAPADTGAADAEEAARIVHTLLDRLSPRDRLVVTLHHLEERSVAETADLTGMSETMVKVQCWRARKRMEKIYNQYLRSEET